MESNGRPSISDYSHLDGTFGRVPPGIGANHDFYGAVGTAAAVTGWCLKIETPGILSLLVRSRSACRGWSFLLVRRQALKNPKLSVTPTRRITQALLPPLVAGLIISVVALINIDSAPLNSAGSGHALAAPKLVILYGCAFHAAGFFMPRGMKIFGWAFILGGCGLLALGIPDWTHPLDYAHGIMGFFFGVLHLAYGVYLYFTEQRKNAA